MMYVLFFVYGLYCGFVGTTAGEGSLVRSMAFQARRSGQKFFMTLSPEGLVEAYTVLP